MAVARRFRCRRRCCSCSRAWGSWAWSAVASNRPISTALPPEHSPNHNFFKYETTMKPSSKLVAAAVATVLGTSAHALAPTAPITYTFYEAGGSAQENSVYAALYSLLSPSSVDVYSDSGKGLSGSYLVVTGTTIAGAGGITQAPFNTPTN